MEKSTHLMTTWYHARMHIEIPQRLCHLPLVMDVLRRSRILDIIDKAIPQHSLSDVSTSECVAVILCGVYVGAHSLWRVRERLAPYDMATVMQDHTFDLQRFPEERLAKALDDLYDFGLDKLMTSIALQVIKHYSVRTDFLHFDTTSLSFYGAYEREDWGSVVDGMPPPRVTFGHSKAKRPDLKQVVFGCLSSGDGGIPLLGKVMDGNMADSLAAAHFFAKVRELVHDPREVCLVADSKGWCDGTLSVVTDHRLRLLSRLPRTESLHRQLMEFPWKPTQIIERPAKRTKGQMERYELMGFDAERTVTFHRENPEDPQHPITEKKVIPVRAVRVYSSALLRTKLATLGRTRNRETRAAAKLIRHWQSIAYACEEDANRAAKRHGDQYHAITHDLKACVERHEGPVKARRGRPRKYPEPTLTKDKHWRITYQTIPVQDEISAQRLHDQASFILIRTRNPGWTITDEAMMDTYRQQYHLEHGFAWLKSGAEINPLFIQTPHRIASMGFVYCLGLLVWNVIQRTVRQYLIAHETGLPYHRGKVSNNITTRFLFELFPSVQSVVLRHPDGQREKRVVGLDKWQLASIKALGCPLNNFKPIMVD